MSFFAGFVNGVFNGMDWRERRDDRATARDRDETRWQWDQEDRTHTVSERERVARERAAAAGRAAAARSRAEEERIAREQAFRDTMSVIEGGTPAPQAGASDRRTQPLSVRPVASDPLRANNNGGGARAPMTVTASGAVPAGREYGPHSSTDLAKQGDIARHAAPVEPRSRMDGEGAPQRYVQDPRARMDGEAPPSDPFADLESQMQQYQRSDAARAQGMSVMAANAMPTPRQEPQPPESYAQAPIRGQGTYIPDTPAERDIARRRWTARPQIPDSPTRMDTEGRPRDQFDELEEQMRNGIAPIPRSQIMRDQAQDVMPEARAATRHPAPRAQTPAPMPTDEAGIRAAQAADVIPSFGSRAMSILRGAADTLGRQTMAQQAMNRDTVGTGLSVLGAPEAGAESMRAAERSRAVAERPGQTFGAPLRAPAGQVPMPPAAGGAQSAPASRQQGAAASVPQGMAEQAVAGPDQAPRTPGGAPMGSVQSVARATMTVLESGRQDGNRPRTPPTDAEIQSIARQAQQDFQAIGMLPIVRYHLERGDYAAAQAAEEFFNRRATQSATRAIMGALVSASYQDADGVLDGLAEAYNTPGYYADGQTVLREQSTLRFTPGGDVEGEIAFRDDATGRVTRRNITGMQNALQMALGELMPETVWERVQAGAFGQGQASAAPPSNSDRTAIRRQATEEARIVAESARGIGAVPTIEEIDQSEARLLRGRGVSASGVGSAPPPVFY